MTERAVVVGWRGIADYISERAPFTFSIDTIMRWSRRRVDPLPVRRWGTVRPRVYTPVADLDAWLERQLRDKEHNPA